MHIISNKFIRVMDHSRFRVNTFVLQGAYKNDFLGLEFEPMFSGEPKMKGEEVIK